MHTMSAMCITRGCQTVFRESEAQTVPWAPPYTVISTETPEVLTLACLTWGSGLPAGKYEIEVIERLRKKRAWEKYLAGNVPVNDFETRRRIISDIEHTEQTFREQEIEDLQSARFELAQEDLQKHAKEVRCRVETRLRLIAKKALLEKKDSLVKIQKQKERALRKANVLCKGVVTRHKRQGNLIEQYSSASSSLAVPLPRLGFDNRLRNEVLCVKPPFPTTLEGLCKLELRPKKSGQVKCRSRPPVHNCLTRFCRVDDSLPENELDLLFDDEKIFEDVLHEGEDAGPPTPTCEELSDLDELIYQSGLLLQKVIRGRAIQTMMHQGRARHQDLIDELKSTFGLLPEETEHRHAERRQVMTGTRDFTSGKNKLGKVMSVAEQMESSTLIHLADFSSKELLRLEDERRCQELALMAERERWSREAMEAGRRQLELRQLRQFDDIIKQLLTGNELSIDSALGDASRRSMETTASEIATKKVVQEAEKLDGNISTTPRREDSLDDEETCIRLLYNFVMPEANRERIKDELRKSQTVCRKSALQQIYKEQRTSEEFSDIVPPTILFARGRETDKKEARAKEKVKVKVKLAELKGDGTLLQERGITDHIVELSLASSHSKLSDSASMHIFGTEGKYSCPEDDVPLEPTERGQGVWWWIPV